jgi:hypothetical protein
LVEKHENIEKNKMDRIDFPRVQRIAPDVAELILSYRASVEAKDPDPSILAQIQEIQTAIILFYPSNIQIINLKVVVNIVFFIKKNYTQR